MEDLKQMVKAWRESLEAVSAQEELQYDGHSLDAEWLEVDEAAHDIASRLEAWFNDQEKA